MNPKGLPPPWKSTVQGAPPQIESFLRGGQMMNSTLSYTALNQV
jgi:hypothetical protein